MTGSTILDVVIAVAIGVVVWRLALMFIRALSTPPPEIDPEDVVTADQDYRCAVCGAELTMRMVNVAEDKPPRHCREDMVPVWRP
ncbi:MAG: hypothetical protein L0Z63_04305 [Actinobacteria bacterium]|nr:hypothetical protein [Actinomycetota bacterium]